MPQLLYQTKYYIIKVSVSLPYILVPQPLMISSISNICLTQAVWFCQPPPPPQLSSNGIPTVYNGHVYSMLEPSAHVSVFRRRVSACILGNPLTSLRYPS